MNTNNEASFKEKFLLYVGYFLFISVIYVLIDLYDPLKRVLEGESIRFMDMLAQVEFKKKLPLILIFSLLLARTTLSRRMKKREAQTSVQK